MTDAHPDAARRLTDLAQRFGFSQAAVRHLSDAVAEGGGDMAMFDHPEFAGPGQWMRGGLILITEPSNHVLKNRIDALCNALSAQLRRDHADQRERHRRIDPSARAWDTGPVVRERWWPVELGDASVSGTQGETAYAYFDDARRLAIRRADRITFYDTGAHRITGVAQSSHGAQGETLFTSQLGEVPLESLTRTGGDDTADREAAREPGAAPSQSGREILAAIERLGELHRQGVLTDAEFTAKKQELLARL